ncbi:hypothetical protein BBJ28_00011411 [Nothophytophthora sp. Chile5]|nr:hypothetical protein BBJ28_00011411 [Nothophytophthora sp. Chile5]
MSLIATVARMYQKSVGKSLAMYGLKYDDLLVDTAAVQTALHWIPKDEYTARTKRIARATDCSLKRSYLPDEIQAIQRPYEGYMEEKVAEAEAIDAERASLTRCAKPSSTYSKTALSARARPEVTPSESDEEEGEEVVDDDDEEDDDNDAEFGAAAEREHERQQQLQRQQQPRPQPQRHRPGKQSLARASSVSLAKGPGRKAQLKSPTSFTMAPFADTRQSSTQYSRPASAPAGRPKSATTFLRQQDREDGDDTGQRSAAAISIAYLRAAAEKKKTRDREFAVRSRSNVALLRFLALVADWTVVIVA